MKITDKIKANYTSTLAQCSQCTKLLDVLSNKGLIKNRNDARFWGLSEKKFCVVIVSLKEDQKCPPESAICERNITSEVIEKKSWKALLPN